MNPNPSTPSTSSKSSILSILFSTKNIEKLSILISSPSIIVSFANVPEKLPFVVKGSRLYLIGIYVEDLDISNLFFCLEIKEVA